MQQQTIGEVTNSTVCEQIVFVCNRERIVKIGQYLPKLCSNEKGKFLTQSVFTEWATLNGANAVSFVIVKHVLEIFFYNCWQVK